MPSPINQPCYFTLYPVAEMRRLVLTIGTIMQPLELIQSKTVGHAGEIVANSPGHPISVGLSQYSARQLFRLGDQPLEHFLQGEGRFSTLGKHSRMAVDV